ncbi:unnamed protein product [Adineta ricciae]|uniref:G-protein coupled receptors family 1 profile domain-containing protein n=1 Tax=Adineta ricciae TaxID=249248 RepID=A0A814PJA7_ADIRI|nr:unnamed protein product [Adineta ricciae]
MINFQLSLALVMISIYRFSFIVYHTQVFFRTKKWFIICLSSQWLIGFLLPLVSLFAQSNSKCIHSQWISIYIMVFIIVICPLISLTANLRLFLFGHSASRRLHSHNSRNRIAPISAIISNRTDLRHSLTPRISRRDTHILKHTIYMFLMLVFGWGPIYILFIVIHSTTVSTILLGFFCVWAQISLVCLVINMFIFNTQLRKYLMKKIFHS